LKTDTIFYTLFQLFPELLFQLIGEDPSQAPKYEFSSREIKELARRFDGLFLPRGNDFTDLIYFVEVQFQPKDKFYRRLFAEILAYLEQYESDNDWRAVAIFASRSLEPTFSAQYRGLRPQLQVVYLDEIDNGDDLPISLDIVKLVVMAPDQVQEELPTLLEKLPQQITDQELERQVFEFIETVLLYKFTNLSREEIEVMFSLSDLRKTRVYQEAKAEGELKGEFLGKLKAVPGLLALGLSANQIALAIGLEATVVEQIAAGETLEKLYSEHIVSSEFLRPEN
jgi:predicted transposase/invertase (TIGR01784 family)